MVKGLAVFNLFAIAIAVVLVINQSSCFFSIDNEPQAQLITKFLDFFHRFIIQNSHFKPMS